MKPNDKEPEIPAQDVPLDQLLGETLDLADQWVDRVTEDDVEHRLRQVLAAAAEPRGSAPTTADPAITADLDGEGRLTEKFRAALRNMLHTSPHVPCQGETGDGVAIDFVTIDLKAMAWVTTAATIQEEIKRARQIAVAAFRDAEAAQAEADKARADAEAILSEARQRADQYLDAALEQAAATVAAARAGAQEVLDAAQAEAAAATANARREASEILATASTDVDCVPGKAWDSDDRRRTGFRLGAGKVELPCHQMGGRELTDLYARLHSPLQREPHTARLVPVAKARPLQIARNTEPVPDIPTGRALLALRIENSIDNNQRYVLASISTCLPAAAGREVMITGCPGIGETNFVLTLNVNRQSNAWRSCATAVNHFAPECLGQLHNNFEAVLDYTFAHADKPIHNLEAWISSRLKAATVNRRPRRRVHRGAMQRLRIPAWINAALDRDPWLATLSIGVLRRAGIPHTEVHLLEDWPDLPAQVTGNRVRSDPAVVVAFEVNDVSPTAGSARVNHVDVVRHGDLLSTEAGALHVYHRRVVEDQAVCSDVVGAVAAAPDLLQEPAG